MRMFWIFLCLGLLASCASEPQTPVMSHHPLLKPAPNYLLPDVSRESVAYVQLRSTVGVLGGMVLHRVDGNSVKGAHFTDSKAVREAYDAAIRVAPSKDRREAKFLPVRAGPRSFIFTYSEGMKWEDLVTLADPTRKTVELVGNVSEGRFYHVVPSKPGPSGAVSFWMEDVASGKVIATGVAQ